MSTSRSHLSDPTRPGSFHGFNRCVQEIHLLETPEYKAIFLELLAKAQAGFIVEITGYSIQDNRFDLDFQTHPELLEKLTHRDIATRWVLLYPKKARKSRNPKRQDALSEDQQREKRIEKLLQEPKYLEILRARLGSPSWMMRFIQAKFSRQINAINDRRGTCWEGPYKATELLNPTITLVALLFSDLRTRQGPTALQPEVYSAAAQRQTAETPETASLLSAKEPRLRSLSEVLPTPPIHDDDYLTVLEELARWLDGNMVGGINPELEPLFANLGLDLEGLRRVFTNPKSFTGRATGTPQELKELAQREGQTTLYDMTHYYLPPKKAPSKTRSRARQKTQLQTQTRSKVEVVAKADPMVAAAPQVQPATDAEMDRADSSPHPLDQERPDGGTPNGVRAFGRRIREGFGRFRARFASHSQKWT